MNNQQSSQIPPPVAKPILDKFATTILEKSSLYEKNGKTLPNTSIDKKIVYKNRGYKGDEVLWIAPSDSIRIEFDQTTKEQSDLWIAEAEHNAKIMGFDTCITGHNGISDYLNMFNISGIPLGEQNKEAKKLLAQMICPKKALKHLDLTNLGDTFSPIIGHPHWKKIYNGNPHRIIRGKNPVDHKNTYPKELLKILNKPKKKEEKKKDTDKSRPKDENSDVAKIKAAISISDLLEHYNMDTTNNPTMCPTGHESSGKACLSFDEAEDVYNCFNCGSKGDIFSMYMDVEDCDFTTALKGLAAIAGIEITPPKKKEVKSGHNLINKKPDVLLPGADRNNSEFAEDVIRILNNHEDVFYNSSEGKMIEVDESYDKSLGKSFVLFKTITPPRLISIIDKHMNCVKLEFDKDNIPRYVVKSAPETLCRSVLSNLEVIKKLPVLTRILRTRVPFFVDKKLVYPVDGYNANINAFLSRDAPKLMKMSMKQAKDMIEYVLQDFPFKEPVDKTFAISALITPACRGLYPSFTTRTPLYMYLANRERVGKDALASIASIMYEGQKIEQPAFTSTKRGVDDDELRKKLTSQLRVGTKRYHSSNNKGNLSSAVLEQFLTLPYWSDRILGGNEIVTFPNEMDISMSANSGIRWSPDVFARSRPINQFLAMEDTNKRVFKIKNFDETILKYRPYLISAIVTFIQYWYDQGMPPASTTFNSFPEWSRVTGGITECIGYGNPCVTVEEPDVGGDEEKTDMKALYHLMYDIQKNTDKKEHTVRDICNILMAEHAQGSEIFSNINFSDVGKRNSFSRKFRKYVDRELDDIYLKIATNNSKSERVTWKFINQ